MQNYIYLMRHGHIDTNGYMIGQTDLPLSHIGQEQSKYWKEFFKNTKFDTIFTSPLTRTKETAQIIIEDYANTKSTIIKDFCEISLGTWEGMKKAEIKEKYKEEWEKRGELFYSTPPTGGESFIDLEQRVLPAFYNLCNSIKSETQSSSKHILIVAHQAVNRIILADIQKLDKRNILQIQQDYACVNVLELAEKIQFIKKIDCPIKEMKS